MDLNARAMYGQLAARIAAHQAARRISDWDLCSGLMSQQDYREFKSGGKRFLRFHLIAELAWRVGLDLPTLVRGLERPSAKRPPKER